MDDCFVQVDPDAEFAVNKQQWQFFPPSLTSLIHPHPSFLLSSISIALASAIISLEYYLHSNIRNFAFDPFERSTLLLTALRFPGSTSDFSKLPGLAPHTSLRHNTTTNVHQPTLPLDFSAPFSKNAIETQKVQKWRR